MNYLPIILKIPNKTYQISINTQYFYNGTSPQGEIAHHIMINEICLKTKKEHLRHNITVINNRDIEKSIGMKLTKYYTERLKWFYGEDISIINNDGKHQYHSSFSQARRTGKTVYWKTPSERMSASEKMSVEDILKKYGLNFDDIVQ